MENIDKIYELLDSIEVTKENDNTIEMMSGSKPH